MFALATVRLGDEPEWFRTYYLAAGLTFWTLWQSTTALGLLIGPVVPEEWNLAFAVPILFIGLLVLGIDRWPKVVAAMVGAGTAYLAADLPNKAGLLVGALVGIVAGTVAERFRHE
jgi:predicted branched-subunit amino acid permease